MPKNPTNLFVGVCQDYNDDIITDIAETIENKIENNNVEPDGWYREWDGQVYNDQVIEEFKKAYAIFKLAEVYSHRTDWLFSGDDGEDSFLRRTKEKFEDLEKTDKYGYITKILKCLK